LHQPEMTRPQLAAIYMSALRNEIAIDIDGYNAVGAVPADFGCLPRLSAVWSGLNRYRWASSIALRLLRSLWKLGLYVPFFLLQYRSLVSTIKTPEPFGADQTLHVLLSRLAPAAVAKADGTASLAFTVPWQQYPDSIPHSRQIGIGDVLTRKDIRSCLVEAIAIARRIARRNTLFSAWHLQTYTLFRWVCVARAIERVQCKRMVAANHYDRWAILVDRIGGEAKRSTVVVQHGIVATRYLPTKLRFTETIYVLNREQETLFKSFILAPQIAATVNVHFLDNAITLSELLADESRIQVVLVGHPQYDVDQVRFLKAARLARPDVQFIYKAHPTARGVNPEIRSATTLWDQSGIFPKCDFVFSYHSTLGYQYRDAGIPTFIHDKDMSDDQLDEAVRSIPNNKMLISAPR